MALGEPPFWDVLVQIAWRCRSADSWYAGPPGPARSAGRRPRGAAASEVLRTWVASARVERAQERAATAFQTPGVTARMSRRPRRVSLKPTRKACDCRQSLRGFGVVDVPALGRARG